MLNNFQGLLKPEELQLREIKFKGKLAGTAFKYSRRLDGLIMVRLCLFAMSVLVFYPVIINYIFHGVFTIDLFVERAIFSVILLLAGLMFNKFRVVAILLGAIPLALILFMYLTVPGQFALSNFGFIGAVFLIVTSGLYHHFEANKLSDVLKSNISKI